MPDQIDPLTEPVEWTYQRLGVDNHLLGTMRESIAIVAGGLAQVGNTLTAAHGPNDTVRALYDVSAGTRKLAQDMDRWTAWITEKLAEVGKHRA